MNNDKGCRVKQLTTSTATGKMYIKKTLFSSTYHHQHEGRASQGNCINNGEANRGNVPTLDAFPPYTSSRLWGL